MSQEAQRKQRHVTDAKISAENHNGRHLLVITENRDDGSEPVAYGYDPHNADDVAQLHDHIDLLRHGSGLSDEEGPDETPLDQADFQEFKARRSKGEK